MSEIEPAELKPDEFMLSGRIQLGTAIAVLVMTGSNPQAASVLKAYLDLHDAHAIPGAQDDLFIFWQGEVARQTKTDVIASALLAEKNERLSDAERIAAGALLRIFRVQK